MKNGYLVVAIVLIICLTFYNCIARICEYGENTTWESVEIEKAKQNSTGYWQGKYEGAMKKEK